ncbi:MAG: LysM peptidoglycan-binding domain-containing protein [Chloroflexi bacterium]|nr:LysM peptidoglycan-binding domain-containing protein [Chloroflexota bacterium]
MSATRRVLFCLWGMFLILALSACAAAAPAQPVALATTSTPLPSLTATPKPSHTPVPTTTFSPTPIPSPTATNTPVAYVVRIGDSFWRISRRFGITVDALLQANGLNRNATLRPGETLMIPKDTSDQVALQTDTTSAASTSPSAPPAAGAAPSGPAPAKPAQARTHDNRYARAAKSTPAPPHQPATGPSAKTEPAQQKPAGVTHIVRSGDSLSNIAIENGASVEVIMAANGIEDPTRLRVGQELLIPLGTATPVPVATRSPSPSPTASLPYAVPAPLWPINGTRLAADESPTLSWTSVGILDPEEYYVVRLERLRGPAATQSWMKWLKTTSWRVSPDLRDPEQTKGQLYRWSVVVMRHTGTEKDSSWTGLPLSNPSPTRRFLWPLPVKTAPAKPNQSTLPIPVVPSAHSD